MQPESDALLSPDSSLEDWIRHLNSVKKEYEQGITLLNVFRESLRLCCETFQHDERFRSDPRYLSVWLAYIKRLPQLAGQLEAFVRMESLQIGLRLANFWTERAVAFERANMIPEAYNCFNLAYYKYHSSPPFHLARSLRDFHSRINLRKSKGHFHRHNLDETVPGRQSGYMRAYFYGDGVEFSFEELRSTLMILREVDPDPEGAPEREHERDRERFQISDISEPESESSTTTTQTTTTTTTTTGQMSMQMPMDVDYEEEVSESDGDFSEQVMDVDRPHYHPPARAHDYDGMNLNGRKRKKRPVSDMIQFELPESKKRKIVIDGSGVGLGIGTSASTTTSATSMSETPSSEVSSSSLSGGFFIREDTVFLTPGRLKERRKQEQDALQSAGVEESGSLTTDLTELNQFRKSMGFGFGIGLANGGQGQGQGHAGERNTTGEQQEERGGGSRGRGRGRTVAVAAEPAVERMGSDLESDEGDIGVVDHQKENRRPQQVVSEETERHGVVPNLPCPSFVASSEVSQETAFDLYRENDDCFAVVPFGDAPALFSETVPSLCGALSELTTAPTFRFSGRMYRIHRHLENAWFSALDVENPSMLLLVKIGATVWEYHVLNLIRRRMGELQTDAFENCFLQPVGFLAHQRTSSEGEGLSSVLVCRQPEKICWSLSFVVDTIQKNISKRLKIGEDLAIHYSFALLRALKFARDGLGLVVRDMNLRHVWISDSPRGILLPDLESVVDLRCSSDRVGPSGVSYARFVHQLLFKSDLNGDESSGWTPARIPYHFARDLWNQLFSRCLSSEVFSPDDILPLFEQFYSERERKRRVTVALHANVVNHLFRMMMTKKEQSSRKKEPEFTEHY